jgi:hypothetical protein
MSLNVTLGEMKKPGENEKTPKKNRYFTKIEPYLYELQMNQVLAFTHEKLKRFCLKFDNVFKIPYV